VNRDEVGRVPSETRPKSVFASLGLMHADQLSVSEARLELAVSSPFSSTST
jgi:hypothetical protein